MKLFYLDESGNTGIRSDDLSQPYHLIAALVVDDANIRLIENEVRLLGLKHFGSESRNTDFEFHGHQIYSGKGQYFSKIKIELRIQIMEDLLNILKKYELQIIYSIINKLSNKAQLHPHQLAFLFLIERIEDYLTRENTLGLLVADENRDIEQRLIDDLERFKTTDTGFGYRPTKIEHIVDSIHFVKSHNNHLIQLADVVAHVLLRGKRVNEELRKQYYKEIEGVKDRGNFLEWIESKATLKQKTELKCLNLISYKPMIFKEFPVM